MTEHVRIFLGSIHKFEGGKDVLGDHGQELENGAIPSPDDNAVVNESQRRWDIVPTNTMGPEGQFVMDIPKRESGVLGNGSQCEMRNIEIKRDQALLQRRVRTWQKSMK